MLIETIPVVSEQSREPRTFGTHNVRCNTCFKSHCVISLPAHCSALSTHAPGQNTTGLFSHVESS